MISKSGNKLGKEFGKGGGGHMFKTGKREYKPSLFRRLFPGIP